MSYYAIDFGTSNSLLNYVDENNNIHPVPLDGDEKFIMRSLLFTGEKNQWFFGEKAIEEFIERDGDGRFFRSLKKFLPEPSYKGTEVHNKKMKITDLIATFLREVRKRADSFTGKNIEKVVLGRPALYSSDLENDQLAENRMREAAQLAGFKGIHFCPEPLAAGLDYERVDKKERIVLIADFGGGTSDFTLLKFHSGEYSQDDILGLSGVFIAGDALDGEMMRRFISKHFGSEFEYKASMGKNVLRFPRPLLKKICSPAHITHLRERETWDFLKEIQKHSIGDESERQMDQLFTLVEDQLGFPIFDKIEKSKIQLCQPELSEHLFEFSHPGIDIQQTILKSDYELRMQPVVDKIFDSLMDVFKQANIGPEDVDQICLTGGTGQFKLIRERLKSLFGEEKLVEHNIYQSVVGGLAQYGLKVKV